MKIGYSDYRLLFGDFAKIPEGGFDLWTQKSIAEINRYLSLPIAEIPSENREICIFEVAESLYSVWENQGIASENTDGYSVTYREKSGEIGQIIRRYLAEFIYRGIEK